MTDSSATAVVHARTPASPQRRFGTFDGVFTPTLLTILGVIMYLREGWVVGQLGLLGAWLVVLLASVITVCTALSLSSVATNVRLEAGGPYAIISRSLGLELGGSVGIPLYLSQALAVAMYIFGLREGWCWIFPTHPPLVVDLITFVLVVGVASFSASLAFRVQYVVMGVIALSLLSVLASLWTRTERFPIEWWPERSSTPSEPSFWVVFAVFFPAVTGITAGANMSGELKDPRRSIPRGTLAAVGLGSAVYFALAYWLARSGTPDQLRNNYTIMVDRAAWAPLVLAGLLGATFSSALGSIVGAPRILRALGEHGIVPFGDWLVGGPKDGEPRRAILITAAIIACGLGLRDLNTIAPLITMFFLITYAMINVVVLLEQRLAVVSFRPSLRLPAIIPLVGTVGCMVAMFVINATFSLVAVVIVLMVYGVLMRRRLHAPGDDVRSGLFLALAEWAARRSTHLPKGRSRVWKANLLLPVIEPQEVLGNFPLIVDLTVPYGSITLLGIAPALKVPRLRDDVERLADDFSEAGVHATATVIAAESPARGIVHAMQTLRGAFLRPNVLFLTPLATSVPGPELEKPLRAAKDNQLGVVLAALHPKAALGRHKVINVWIRSQAPDWELKPKQRLSNLNLLILVSYVLRVRWAAHLSLICVVTEGEQDLARQYLADLVDQARIPRDVQTKVVVGNFEDSVRRAQHADVSVFGLPEEDELEFVAKMVELAGCACLFVRDSGDEDALA